MGAGLMGNWFGKVQRCGSGDPNPHECYLTATSTRRVDQFRHDRMFMCLVWARLRQTAAALQVKKCTSLMTISTWPDIALQNCRCAIGLSAGRGTQARKF